jgi:hypothetical protein
MNQNEQDPEEIIHTELELRFMGIYAKSPFQIRIKDVQKAIELYKKGDMNGLQSLAVKGPRQTALTE